jgi:hypothetical protein
MLGTRTADFKFGRSGGLPTSYIPLRTFPMRASRLRRVTIAGLITIIMHAVCISTPADEGMWLFNDLPKDYLKKKYDFVPTDEWADHLMKASVRFNVGGSASFVSSSGLVLTNHHVGSDAIQKLSTSEHDYYRDGFLARTTVEELKTPDLELNQLVSIEDVTARVNAAVKPDLTAEKANAARRAVMAQIEKESLEATKLRSDVVTLYGGARYHLYRYKKYTDVRLVWAPEKDIAFFGGDADNFEYPRYDLDACLFRVYEDDKPAKIEHFLRWSKAGAEDGELVFVSGNPGRTSRIYTVAALKHLRDARVPFALDYLRRKEVLLQQYANEGTEQARQANEELFSMQNSRKAYTGMLAGLQDPAFIAQKAEEEGALKAKARADAKLRDNLSAWQQVAAAQETRASIQRLRLMFTSRLYDIAETLVQMAAEDKKPSEERLREYRESNRDSLEQELYSTAPIYPELEQYQLADDLTLLGERRGGDDSLVRSALGGKSPQDLASEAVRGTKLVDVEVRRELAKGGEKAIKKSTDPMIRLAKALDAETRRIRKITEEQIEETERQAYARIAEVIFAARGTSTYPDATFTLRLSLGVVKGYEENGRKVAPWTTLGGAFRHAEAHGNKEPWQLPKSWHAARDRLDLETPFNFVCTADIIGGNSGSPVVNRAGEFVGIIFDGNIQSLTADYSYSETQSRAVSVHSSAIREALRKVYDAGRLADELGK